MLKITGLRKSFKNTEVLKGVDLTVKAGETLVIVGPSGGGKTTLLRCVNALEKADKGTIEINGKKLCYEGKYVDKNGLKDIRRDVGMVFQGYNLFPHMSVLENLIEAPQRVFGVSKEKAIENSREILGFLGLSDKENNYPFELSGGQKQRVAIGRALALEPKLMCFDEPTSALDPSLTDEVGKLIKSLNLKGMSNLIITHDMEFAKKVADRIFSMDKGVLKEGLIFEE
ncbi:MULTISPECIES: amino acid ABC transporter ATP-binding protein [Clostridium]|uniref:Amino acid ABC transporter ATP-binding protein n=1 Tax=Clostridium cibarium TaxID=2762247 RepID=A0ABR8PVZ5_9CLOT|nr:MULTISPECIES: amino acid ABC transporter ATP-binding protein [Clostridium]MBD7912314.1 amino acid ABC transporter ATP-binding protein [Clostridium cibarium]